LFPHFSRHFWTFSTGWADFARHQSGFFCFNLSFPLDKLADPDVPSPIGDGKLLISLILFIERTMRTMGIKQRREREKQEIRQRILSTAREIAAEEGWQAVTTRKVAERIEYSQSTIYEYFENKEAILLALLRSGYEQLVVVMQAAFASTDDPEARLLAMTEAYWDFAFRSPELYQVMHGLAGISFGRYGHPETPIEVKQSFGLAREAMEQWAQARGVEKADITDLVEARRGVIHGLITLTMARRIAGGPERVKPLLQETMKDLLFAWSHRPPG
jgi:AcrR family transcriptional regulator